VRVRANFETRTLSSLIARGRWFKILSASTIKSLRIRTSRRNARKSRTCVRLRSPAGPLSVTKPCRKSEANLEDFMFRRESWLREFAVRFAESRMPRARGFATCVARRLTSGVRSAALRTLRGYILLTMQTAIDAAGRMRAAEPRGSSLTGERRRLTLLFCDLVNSTSLAARLDPEEWRETVAGYHRAATQAIECFGGHVAEYQGDGVMAYFGWPEAHDNDERAARAALAIVNEIAKLNQHSARSSWS
jgi:hypothetical protein